jgi:hypothetical protein
MGLWPGLCRRRDGTWCRGGAWGGAGPPLQAGRPHGQQMSSSPGATPDRPSLAPPAPARSPRATAGAAAGLAGKYCALTVGWRGRPLAAGGRARLGCAQARPLCRSCNPRSPPGGRRCPQRSWLALTPPKYAVSGYLKSDKTLWGGRSRTIDGRRHRASYRAGPRLQKCIDAECRGPGVYECSRNGLVAGGAALDSRGRIFERRNCTPAPIRWMARSLASPRHINDVSKLTYHEKATQAPGRVPAAPPVRRRLGCFG